MTTAHGEGETGILRCFGQQLRLLRTSRGLTRAELGAKLSYGEDMVASVELGRRIPKPEFIERADAVLEAGGLLTVMKEKVARARYSAFFREAAKLEAEAVELHVYANQAVPGLLQTEEYARAVFGVLRPPLDDAIVNERVAARLARQEIFHRTPHPLMSFVIDEAVRRRPIGGRDVLREQLEQVLLVSHMRHVEVQVMPLSRDENAEMAGPFTLIETKGERRIAYVEVQNVSRVHSDRESVRALEAKYGTLARPGADASRIARVCREVVGRAVSIDKEVPGADTRLRWFRSSYSSEEGGECVEVAIDSIAVHVRDSKQALEYGPVLTVGPVVWMALLDAM